MNIKYIDNHSHINFKEFDADRDDVIARAEEAGVAFITVGTGQKTSTEALELSEGHEHIYAIVGLHPIYAVEETFDKDFFEKIITHPKVVGVGECGFDFFHHTPDTKEIQEIAFRGQIELALKFDKPLMLHIRIGNGIDAYKETLRVLKEYPVSKGEAHFFAGSLEDAKAFLDLGFYISFTGVITVTNQYDYLVRSIPLDRLLSETDSPYVAPKPYRGKRCEPAFVIEVIKNMAEIKGLGFEEVSKQLFLNSKKLWGI